MKLFSKNFGATIVIASAALSSAVFAEGEESVSDNEVMQLLEIRSQDAILRPSSDISRGLRYENCTLDAFKKNWSSVKNYFSQGNNSMGSVQATMAAGEVSACALKKIKSPNDRWSLAIPNMPIEGWAQEVGGLLTLNVMASGDRVAADQAMKLLTFAKQHGRDVDDFITKIKEILGTNEPLKEKPALVGTAVSIVSKFVSNPFAFDQEYKGKVLQANGLVAHINGDSSHVSVQVLGNTKKSKDDLSWQDTIQCEVTNPNQIQKVSRIAVGKNAAFRGTYKKDIMGGIALKNCEIL